MVECRVRFIYKPNAFLIILEVILRFGLQNHQSSTGFIRYFSTFPGASKHCFTNGFLMFRKVAKRIQLLLKNVMLFYTF